MRRYEFNCILRPLLLHVAINLFYVLFLTTSYMLSTSYHPIHFIF